MAANHTLRLEIAVDDKGSPVVKQFAGSVKSAADVMDKHASKATQTFSAQLGTLDLSLGKVLKGAAGFAAGFAGFQGLGALVGDAAARMKSFDAEMANVNSLLAGSSVGVAELRAQLTQLPPALGSSTELAKGLYETLSAGVAPAQAVAFVGEAAKLAKAGLTETNTAVKVLTATMDAYGKGAEQAGHISDVLFTAVKIGKTTMGELASTIGNVLPVAQNLGVSFEETAATVTTLTKVFPSTSQAVTGLRSILSGMIQNMDAFTKAGINLNEVIATKGLTGALEALKTVTGGSADKVRAFIPDVEGLTAVLGLMGAQLDTQKSNVQAFGTVVGATGEAFRAQQTSFEAASDKLANSWDRLVQRAGPPLLEMLSTAANFWADTLTPAVDSNATALAHLSVELKGVVDANQAAIDKLKALDAAERAAQQSTTALTQATTGLGEATQATASKTKKLDDVFATFGQKTPLELHRAAQTMSADFATLADSGIASQEAIADAARQTVDALTAAYGSQIPAAMQATYDRAKAVLGTVAQAAQATVAPIGQAGEDAGNAYAAGLEAGAKRGQQALEQVATAAQRRTQDIDQFLSTNTLPEFGPIKHPFGDTRQELEQQLADYTRQRANIANGRTAGGGSTLGTRGYRENQLPVFDEAIAQIRARLADRRGETHASGQDYTTQGQVAVLGSGEMVLNRHDADALRDARVTSGGGTTVQVNNPVWHVTFTGIDPKYMDGQAVTQQLLKPLREALRRGELQLT